jgi:hypothetical protein
MGEVIMKGVKWGLAVLALAAFTAAPALAAGRAQSQSWTGKISDSMCGADHGKNGGTVAKDHACTVACVKNGGKYVFVVGSKVYDIANQKFAGLDTNAGAVVKVTGTIKDDAITVTKIAKTK